ncbi:hypothetical protein IF2G_04696 [Cordyceps javanica]|nr:hypothetical protein IF2G_04696 [Cordyceps javanica]
MLKMPRCVPSPTRYYGPNRVIYFLASSRAAAEDAPSGPRILGTSKLYTLARDAQRHHRASKFEEASSVSSHWGLTNKVSTRRPRVAQSCLPANAKLNRKSLAPLPHPTLFFACIDFATAYLLVLSSYPYVRRSTPYLSGHFSL